MANKEHLLLWVEDLESGQHQQTTNVMCRVQDGRYSYCCLGRLSEVAIANGINVERYDAGEFIGYGAEPHTGILAHPVAAWLGVGRHDLTHYANMNDRCSPFVEIAKRIRTDFEL